MFLNLCNVNIDKLNIVVNGEVKNFTVGEGETIQKGDIVSYLTNPITGETDYETIVKPDAMYTYICGVAISNGSAGDSVQIITPYSAN